MRIPVGEWIPDSEKQVFQLIEAGGLQSCNNAMPCEHGYRNWREITETGTAASERLTGAGNGVQTDGTFQQFAGGATKLFRYSSGWTDASRASGGAYTGSTNNWTFAQFGTLMIGCNGADAPQKFTIGGTGNFSALGGSPPVAQYVAVVRDFVVMANVSGATNRVQWSAINDAEDWTASASTQSDSQDIPDEGPVLGIIGGEYGLIFFANAVYRMTYIGSPVIFQFDKISDIGILFPMSAARRGDDAYYVSKEGFATIRAGQAAANFGNGKVNAYLIDDLGGVPLQSDTSTKRAFGAIDPANSLYCFAYMNNGVSIGCNQMLVYHWPTGKWGIYKPSQPTGNRAEVLFRTIVSGADTVATVNDNHKLAQWTGDNESVTILSRIFKPYADRRFFARGIRALIGNAGHLETAATVRTWPGLPGASAANTLSANAENSSGIAPLRASGLFLQVSFGFLDTGASGTKDWVLQGWEIDLIPEGER